MYRKFLPGYKELVLNELSGLNTILDVGCGSSSPLRFKKNAHKVGIDICEKELLKSKNSHTHNEYRVMNALDIDTNFPPKSFDAVVALDVIEHFTKKEGLALIKKMERIARKKVIIFTPNGFVQQHADENRFQEHKSGWMVEDFKKLNYNVIGVNGLKSFRTELSKFRCGPYYFWLFISDATQAVTKHIPSCAFQLLATRKLSFKNEESTVATTL